MTGTEDASWEEIEPRYRARWQQRYAGVTNSWQEHAPAYRYAWEMANMPGYQHGRSWGDVAPELQRGWEL